MSILNTIKATIGRKQEASKLTLETLATVPLRQMRRREGPFNDWRAPNAEIPSVLEDLFEQYARLYQLYAFYLLTARRFGFEIADQILQYQVKSIRNTSDDMAALLESAIRQIHQRSIRHVNDPQFIESGGSRIEVPVEQAIAMEFLTVGETAPFHVSPEDREKGRTRGMNGTGYALAECLGHARDSARSHFQPLIETVRIEL